MLRFDLEKERIKNPIPELDASHLINFNFIKKSGFKTLELNTIIKFFFSIYHFKINVKRFLYI